MNLVRIGHSNATMKIFNASEPNEDFKSVILELMMRDDDKWLNPNSTNAKFDGEQDAERNVQRRDLRRCYRLEMALTWGHHDLAATLIKENRFLANLERKEKESLEKKMKPFEPGGVVFAQMRMLKYALMNRQDPTMVSQAHIKLAQHLDSRWGLLSDPSTKVPPAKTRLESSIQKFNPHLIYVFFFRPSCVSERCRTRTSRTSSSTHPSLYIHIYIYCLT